MRIREINKACYGAIQYNSKEELKYECKTSAERRDCIRNRELE